MTVIKKIHINGFKSFARPIDLEFSNGYSAIIGPNGSGKSNVGDSVCFVLGKLSAKGLRAEKSSNLIFNGGKKGSPAKHAEVSIFFDNEDREFPIDSREVKITRIVKQKGNSVYKINDEVRTREQILELLNAAKIDPDGHNIVLQGDIVRFTEMKPDERRGLIEEISGITVYEDRKQKALSELEKVEGKLNEASIILTEREAYLRELKKDRDQALKYKELEKNIKSNKGTYFYLQIKEREEKRDEIDKRINKQKEEIERINKSISDIKKDINNKNNEIERINKDIEEKSEKESVALQKDIESLRTEIVRDQERIKTCENDIKRLDERKKQLKNNLNEIDNTLNYLNNTDKELNEKIKELNDREQGVEKELTAFKEKHGISDIKELESIEKKLDSSLLKLQNLQDKKQELMQKKFVLDAKIVGIEEKIKSVKEIERSVDLNNTRKEYRKIEEELIKSSSELNVVTKQLTETKDRLVDAESKYYKLKALNAGFQESLLSDKALKRVLELKEKGIYGTIAQLGRVDNKYSLALEVAAGPRLKSLVVEDDKVAERCINILKQEKLGIVTFLPLNKIKQNQPFRIDIKGVVGSAINLVSFDKKFQNAFSYVFGNTTIVENIDVARKVGIGRTRMVTLDGDLIEASGAMVGGYRHRTGIGFVKDSSGELNNIETEINRLEKLRDNLEKKNKELEIIVNKLKDKKSELSGEIIKAEKSLGDVDVNSLEKEKELILKNKIFSDIDDLDKDIVGLNKEIEEFKNLKNKHKDIVAKIRSPQFGSSLNNLEARKQKIRENIVQINSDIKNIELQIKNIYIPEKEKIIEEDKQAGIESNNFIKELQILQKNIKGKESGLKQKEVNEARFQKDYKNLFLKRNKLSEDIHKLNQNLATKEQSSKETYDKINDISISRAKVIAEIEALEKEYDEFRGVELRNNIQLETLKDEIKKFEQMLQNMGNVNLRALEIYEDINKEYEGLLEKVDKLKNEKEDVLKMMYEIESKKKDIFLQTFNIITNNFNKIFTSLSMKGEALLELENKEDPLNGGVEIKVRITGNRFLDIKGLSGGEKTLAALAFIFAIQEHQPASFYLLDEVDAALDKRNSELLSKLISKYAENAQYIIISHNDQIITEAEYIYGVSMQESGISKIVSLKV